MFVINQERVGCPRARHEGELWSPQAPDRTLRRIEGKRPISRQMRHVTRKFLLISTGRRRLASSRALVVSRNCVRPPVKSAAHRLAVLKGKATVVFIQSAALASREFDLCAFNCKRPRAIAASSQFESLRSLVATTPWPFTASIDIWSLNTLHFFDPSGGAKLGLTGPGFVGH